MFFSLVGKSCILPPLQKSNPFTDQVKYSVAKCIVRMEVTHFKGGQMTSWDIS